MSTVYKMCKTCGTISNSSRHRVTRTFCEERAPGYIYPITWPIICSGGAFYEERAPDRLYPVSYPLVVEEFELTGTSFGENIYKKVTKKFIPEEI